MSTPQNTEKNPDDVVIEQLENNLPKGETLFDVILQLVNKESNTQPFKEKFRLLVKAWRRDDQVAFDAACTIIEWVEQQLGIEKPVKTQ